MAVGTLDATIGNLKVTTETERAAMFSAYEAIATGANPLIETMRCKARFAYFLRYVRIPDVNRGLIPYELWGYLIEIADDWQTGDSWVEGKSRQLGYSWLLAAYDVWTAMFRPYSRILSFSIHQKESDELLEKVKNVNRFLPVWLRVDLVTDRKDYIKWANEAEMHSLPSTGQAGRSYTATLVQTDEWAFHENAAAHFSAYRSAIADGGQHLAISTGNGIGNLFHKYFVSTDPELPYKKRFNGWRTRPGRDDKWYARERAAFQAKSADAEDEDNFGKHPGLFTRENPESIADMFRVFIGLVYDNFDDTVHVKGARFDWKAAKYRVAAVDPGQGDPFAAVVIGESAGGHAHQFAEFYDTGVVAEDVIALWLLEWHKRAPFDMIWVDGVEGTLIATLQARGLPVMAANKERGMGIGHVYGRLEARNYTVAPHCRNTIREYKTYQWRRRKARGGGDEWDTSTPEDHHGDAMDCTRYALVGLAKGFQRTWTATQPAIVRPKHAADDTVTRRDPVSGGYYDPGVRQRKNRQPDFRRKSTAGAPRRGGPNLAGLGTLAGTRR